MFVNTLIHLFYPRRCPICGQIVAQAQGYIHESCRKTLVYVRKPVCMRCGKPIYSPLQEYCFDCSKKAAVSAFDGGAAVWVYTKEMMASIAQYKYHGKKEYARFFANEAVRLYGSWMMQCRPDCITAVPLNRKKMLGRGFNQAALVARRIGRQLKIPVDEHLLVRSRFTAPQKELTPEQRLRNLQRAFGPGKNAGRYERILLVDDIYTTGSTMQICSMILKKSGAQHVWILSLCIGSDY